MSHDDTIFLYPVSRTIHTTMTIERTLEEILAAECGGTPSDYEIDESGLRSLDDAETTDIDLNRDKLPAEFDDLDLDDIEEIDESIV